MVNLPFCIFQLYPLRFVGSRFCIQSITSRFLTGLSRPFILCGFFTQRNKCDTEHGRAIALLVTLVLVLVVGVAVGMLYATAMHHSSSKRTDEYDATCRMLDNAISDVILSWLAHKSADSVLPADVMSPRTIVIDETITLPLADDKPVLSEKVSFQAHITIHAFDQQGMIPIHFIHTALPFQQLVDSSVTDLIGYLSPTSLADAGLDTLYWHAESRPELAVRVYPILHDDALLSVGELIGTHNPLPQTAFIRRSDRLHKRFSASDYNVPQLNIHTAPLSFIQAAMRQQGVDFLSQLRTARESGEKLGNIPAFSDESKQHAGQKTFNFVPSSTCWSFRIDITVDTLKQSWWVTYAQQQSDWYKVQQLAIP